MTSRVRPGVRPALLALIGCVALSLPLAPLAVVRAPQAPTVAQEPLQAPRPRVTATAATRSHVRPVLPTPTVRQVTRRPAKRVTRTGLRQRLTDRALAALGGCENGGKYTSAPSHRWRGRYQYDPGTWRRLWTRWGNPRVAAMDPAAASPATQDQTIRRHWQEGANPRTQWPGCTRKLGAWWAL